MDVRFTDDVEEYAAAVGAFLERDPVRCTVSLSVIASARAGIFDDSAWCWVVDDEGGVVGTASWTPPFELLVSPMPEDAAELVGKQWAGRAPGPKGVVGARPAVERCAQVMAEQRGGTVQERFAERLFRLDEVIEPAWPEGAMRVVEEADTELAVAWYDAFVSEAGVTRGNVEREVAARIADARLCFWANGGEALSLAGTSPSLAKVTRIGPVYTPPEHRGHGYGRALVAAISSRRLAAGDEACCLFTDLANPVSNQIYQQVGYRPVGDYAQLTLVA